MKDKYYLLASNQKFAVSEYENKKEMEKDMDFYMIKEQF